MLYFVVRFSEVLAILPLASKLAMTGSTTQLWRVNMPLVAFQVRLGPTFVSRHAAVQFHLFSPTWHPGS